MANIGSDYVLKALLWRESTWRQFNSDGQPLKNKGSSARGIGQVMEYFWANSRDISHNDYYRIAWQWTYSVEAARDVLDYCRARVRKRKPSANETERTDWSILAYHLGAEVLGEKRDPSADDYVKQVRRLMIDKPWEG